MTVVAGRQGDENERGEREPPERVRQPGRAPEHLLGLFAIEAILVADGAGGPHVSDLLRPPAGCRAGRSRAASTSR